jgi:hypothetical protein
MRRACAVGVLAALFVVLGVPDRAAADLEGEQALADRYAPVVRLVEQIEPCGPGEPYEPMDVEGLFGDPTVALRGPWNPTDLVKIAPSAPDTAGLFEYHLDFPGNPLDAGCSYEQWANRLTAGWEAAVYAHVATDPDHPGKLALQYWFFYAFNDFNNTHEGDWEMIQLVFDAADPAEALEERPVEVGYSSHEGAERAEWGEDKLELVDETHPVVYPAAGSHANKFTDALYLGSSAEAGVGCDDTRGPHVELTPAVRVIPSDPLAAADAFPWITFEGRWGELQPAFFNGPTGPNSKGQWTLPIAWSEGWHDRSYAVPTGGVLGTRATDLFCSGIALGSRGLIQLLRSPGPTLLVAAAAVGLVAFGAAKVTWTPIAPWRVGRRRTWGQIISASARVYMQRPRLFLGLGLLFMPIMLAITVLQWVLIEALGLFGSVTGDLAGMFAYLALVVGTALTLFGFSLVQAATARALVEIDAGQPIGAVEAYRLALQRIRPLVGATLIFVAAWVSLTTVGVLLPVAIYLAIRWSLLAPVVEVEGASAFSALHRSGTLVRGHWIRVGSLVVAGSAIALIAGPLIGVLLIFVSEGSLGLLNFIAGLVYVLALPFVALVTSYVYFDVRTRKELTQPTAPTELPAEISIERA